MIFISLQFLSQALRAKIQKMEHKSKSGKTAVFQILHYISSAMLKQP
jgi:hypothetical protein